MTEFANTRELLEAWPGLDDDVRATLLLAISSRGRYKGYVLASSPPAKSGDKFVAWQALVGELAPVRISVFALMFLTEEQKALHKRLDSALERDPGVGLTLGTAVRAYEPALRWSLFAHRYDVDKLRTLVCRAIAKLEKVA